jgi:hypothetical protein
LPVSRSQRVDAGVRCPVDVVGAGRRFGFAGSAAKVFDRIVRGQLARSLRAAITHVSCSGVPQGSAAFGACEGFLVERRPHAHPCWRPLVVSESDALRRLCD